MPESNLRLNKSNPLVWTEALGFFKGPPQDSHVQPELRNSDLVPLFTVYIGGGRRQPRQEGT